MEVGCFKHSGASTVGSQLPGNPAMNPHAGKGNRHPSHWINSGKREGRVGKTATPPNTSSSCSMHMQEHLKWGAHGIPTHAHMQKNCWLLENTDALCCYSSSIKLYLSAYKNPVQIIFCLSVSLCVSHSFYFIFRVALYQEDKWPYSMTDKFLYRYASFEPVACTSNSVSLICWNITLLLDLLMCSYGIVGLRWVKSQDTPRI